MATHSSTLAWRIPWTEEPGGLQSMGSQRVRHDCHYGVNHNGKERKQKHLCVCITESLCCTAESPVYQLYFNVKKQNKVIKEIYKLLN